MLAEVRAKFSFLIPNKWSNRCLFMYSVHQFTDSLLSRNAGWVFSYLLNVYLHYHLRELNFLPLLNIYMQALISYSISWWFLFIASIICCKSSKNLMFNINLDDSFQDNPLCLLYLWRVFHLPFSYMVFLCCSMRDSRSNL